MPTSQAPRALFVTAFGLIAGHGVLQILGSLLLHDCRCVFDDAALRTLIGPSIDLGARPWYRRAFSIYVFNFWLSVAFVALMAGLSWLAVRKWRLISGWVYERNYDWRGLLPLAFFLVVLHAENILLWLNEFPSSGKLLNLVLSQERTRDAVRYGFTMAISNGLFWAAWWGWLTLLAVTKDPFDRPPRIPPRFGGELLWRSPPRTVIPGRAKREERNPAP